MITYYYVEWTAVKTGIKGRGTKAYPQKEAERYVHELNMARIGLLTHKIVPESIGKSFLRELKKRVKGIKC